MQFCLYAHVIVPAAGKVATYVSSKAGSDSLSSHIEAVLSKRAASEQDGLTARTELTGFTGDRSSYLGRSDAG